MIKFSVILATYNSSKWVKDAIDSVLNQDFSDFELIVINDGSTDNTSEILREYENNIIVQTINNSGVSHARNTGAYLASGEYLAFIDSDDLWIYNKLSCQYKKLLEGYDFCYTNRYNFGNVGDLPLIHTDICRMPEGNIFMDLLFSNMITTSSVVIKKNIFMDLDGFNTKFTHCEDWDLWLRFSINHTIGVCLEPLVRYRHHNIGLSSNYISMAKYREIVIKKAMMLNNEMLDLKLKNKILSKCYSNSGWESAKSKDYINGFKFYIKAISLNTTSADLWYDFLRFITGRI